MRKGVSLRSDRFKFRQKKDVASLRKLSTPAEQLLWQNIRNRNMKGLKFRRQHAIGRFVVDYYCHELKLIIEIDGDIHKQKVSRDEYREQILCDLGYRIIRFSNEDVIKSIDIVLEKVVELADRILTSK